MERLCNERNPLLGKRFNRNLNNEVHAKFIVNSIPYELSVAIIANCNSFILLVYNS